MRTPSITKSIRTIVSFITNERLVNDNHNDGHVFRYYSGLGGQRSEDYVGGLKVTHTPIQK